MENEVIRHYDTLVTENNDPVLDPPILQKYMDRWDGPEFLEALNLSGNESVLEIGVGTGRLACRTAKNARRFVGIDISPRSAARAADHLTGIPGVEIVCGDFLTWETTDTFDVIYSSLTFLHIADKLLAIRRVSDLLTHGGRFILSIGKETDDVLTYSDHTLRLYPDSPDEIIGLFRANRLMPCGIKETEAAYILIAKNPNIYLSFIE